jgi:hypothetical protein
MDMWAKVLGLAVIVALAVGLLWLRSGSKDSEQADAAKQDKAQTVEGGKVVAPVTVPDSALSPPLSPQALQDERLTKVANNFFDTLYGKVGASEIDDLVSKGLSREDSERVVLQATHDWAKCQLDGVLAQAAAQSVPIASVLDFLDKNQGLPLDLDPKGILEQATPCIESVLQRTGLFSTRRPRYEEAPTR